MPPPSAACDHIAKARALAGRATDIENKLIEAHGPPLPEASCCRSRRLRPLGRRLRGRDAARLSQLPRRSRRDGPLCRGADHAHAAASLERQDGATGERLGRRRGCAGLRTFDPACRRAWQDATPGDPASAYPCHWKCRTRRNSACGSADVLATMCPDCRASEPHARAYLCAVRRL